MVSSRLNYKIVAARRHGSVQKRNRNHEQPSVEAKRPRLQEITDISLLIDLLTYGDGELFDNIIRFLDRSSLMTLLEVLARSKKARSLIFLRFKPTILGLNKQNLSTHFPESQFMTLAQNVASLDRLENPFSSRVIICSGREAMSYKVKFTKPTVRGPVIDIPKRLIAMVIIITKEDLVDWTRLRATACPWVPDTNCVDTFARNLFQAGVKVSIHSSEPSVHAKIGISHFFQGFVQKKVREYERTLKPRRRPLYPLNPDLPPPLPPLF